MTQPELTFDRPTFPHAPGWKSPGTSQEVAEAVRDDAETLRALCMKTLAHFGPMTADEVAERLGRSVLSTRPRCSELLRQGKIIATGERRKNQSQHSACVWRVI